ncbi:SAF domain-containing protein [Egicoccus sp. AB-alg2]|uniref:SAF domain-containing protein n=1 Tax=Egicoccus sp. AB-alg2 TaxID=3242693 RepID=UPI00359D3786
MRPPEASRVRPPRFVPSLDGTPAALPRSLDALSERWFRAGPRLRLALVVALLVLAATGYVARITTSPWGAPTPVLVAGADLAQGQDLRAQDVQRARWPADLVPSDAVLDVSDARLATAVPAGTVLTARHLASGGVAGALADDQAAVAVPRELLPRIPAGSRVDLVGAASDGTANVLAGDVPVLRVDTDDAWVAVPRADAAAVAGAAAVGALTAVLLPP